MSCPASVLTISTVSVLKATPPLLSLLPPPIDFSPTRPLKSALAHSFIMRSEHEIKISLRNNQNLVNSCRYETTARIIPVIFMTSITLISLLKPPVTYCLFEPHPPSHGVVLRCLSIAKRRKNLIPYDGIPTFDMPEISVLYHSPTHQINKPLT